MVDWETVRYAGDYALLRVRCPGCGATYTTEVSMTAGKSSRTHQVCGTEAVIEHPQLADLADRGWVPA